MPQQCGINLSHLLMLRFKVPPARVGGQIVFGMWALDGVP